MHIVVLGLGVRVVHKTQRNLKNPSSCPMIDRSAADAAAAFDLAQNIIIFNHGCLLPRPPPALGRLLEERASWKAKEDRSVQNRRIKSNNESADMLQLLHSIDDAECAAATSKATERDSKKLARSLAIAKHISLSPGVSLAMCGRGGDILPDDTHDDMDAEPCALPPMVPRLRFGGDTETHWHTQCTTFTSRRIAARLRAPAAAVRELVDDQLHLLDDHCIEKGGRAVSVKRRRKEDVLSSAMSHLPIPALSSRQLPIELKATAPAAASGNDEQMEQLRLRQLSDALTRHLEATLDAQVQMAVDFYAPFLREVQTPPVGCVRWDHTVTAATHFVLQAESPELHISKEAIDRSRSRLLALCSSATNKEDGSLDVLLGKKRRSSSALFSSSRSDKRHW